MTKRAGATLALCLMAMTSLAHAAPPSFDCDGSHSQIDAMICGDDALASLDMQLARSFARAMARANADEVAGLKSDQRVWRAQLRKCGGVASPRACVVDTYERRIADLPTGASR
ncbi:lysozyme inhibitor LprI family protein [Pleomorphomonas sp. PLEO]|uniref:lysozyme inhibitor LprI family protein n=1 Tax=Pleomorphomonas sp. PLEO TaxID=3239306 RepID=UPI00351DCB98